MGRQGRRYGLCNATMGGDPGSPFAAAWLETYRTFRSQGRDQHWDEHSVRIPLELAGQHPVTVFGDRHFFYPLWSQIRRAFRPSNHKLLDKSYSVHLWESLCWQWLQDLSPETIDRRSEIARRLQEIGVI